MACILPSEALSRLLLQMPGHPLPHSHIPTPPCPIPFWEHKPLLTPHPCQWLQSQGGLWRQAFAKNDSSVSHTAAQEPGESCGVSGERLVKASEGREVREGFPEGPWAALPRTVGSNQGARQAQATAGGQREAARQWGVLAQQQGKGQGSGHKWPRE